MADLRTMAMMPPDEQTSVNLSPQMASDNPLLGLANNKLLLQYLSAAGQDIQAGRPLGANVNQVTQQNIAAQNYAKLLKKMLESGGDVKVNKDKVTINYPTNAADGSLNPLAGSGQAGTPGLASGDRGSSGENLRQLNAPSTATATLGGNLVAPNPSSSPLDIPASDLAGLTPQDISGALGLRLKTEELGQQRISDAMKYSLAQQKLNKPEAQFPIPVPGVGIVTETQWKSLPADTRAYAAYVYQSKKLNPTEPVMSFQEFKRIPGDTQLRYLEELMRDPMKMDAAKELRAAGRTTVNVNPVARAEEMAEQEAMRDMDSGRLNKDMDAAISSKEFDSLVARSGGYTDPNIKQNLILEKKKEMIQDAVRRGGGKAFDTKFDPKTGEVTFKVEWRNGKVKEYSYGLYR